MLNDMKNYCKITVLFLGVLFSACHEITTDNVTSVTYYVTFELEGGEEYLLPIGTPYVEPGATAFENGEDVSSKMEIEGSVDSDKVGFYYITYSAVNVDGFPNAVTRKVIVYDPAITTDISGSYTTDIDLSNRVGGATGTITYAARAASTKGDYTGHTITIEQAYPGIFYIDDFFGGFYAPGSGPNYLPANRYMMSGYMSLTSDNKLELCSSRVPAWGDSLKDLRNGIYDPDTGTLKWSAIYAEANYSFNVVLNKN